VFALGDVTAIAEPKMAARAGRHAEVIAANIRTLTGGEGDLTAYRILPPGILVPLGPDGGRRPSARHGRHRRPRHRRPIQGPHLFTDSTAEILGLQTPSSA